MDSATEAVEKPSLKITHFWLYAKDTRRTIQFYGDTLGLEILETFPDGALFKAGGIQLGIHREEGDRKSQPGGTSIILHTPDIKRAYEMLQRKGVRFLTQIQQEPYGQIVSFRDPDGYLLELWQPSQ